jgi:hypothetical protein
MSADRQIYDNTGVAMVGIYLDSDTLTGMIFSASGGRAAVLDIIPTITWISSAAGTIRIALTPTDTSGLVAGSYWIEAKAHRGSAIAELMRAQLTVYDSASSYTPPIPSGVISQATLANLASVYCTDEDIAIRASSDFLVLAIESQRLAYGSDGIFTTADPWTLTSVSNNFTAQSLNTGHVVVLKYPKGPFGGSGNTLAISAVSGSSLTLRRLGMSANVGLAPSPSSGLVGVEFTVYTLSPQAELASWELNRRYNIDPDLEGRRPVDMHDMRDLRQACVLWVLAQRLSASLTGQADSSWMLKLKQYQYELDNTLGRLQIRWRPTVDPQMTTSLMSMRIARG